MPPQYVGYGYQQPFMRPAVPSNFVYPVQQFKKRGQNGHYPPRRGGNSQPPQQQINCRKTFVCRCCSAQIRKEGTAAGAFCTITSAIYSYARFPVLRSIKVFASAAVLWPSCSYATSACRIRIPASVYARWHAPPQQQMHFAQLRAQYIPMQGFQYYGQAALMPPQYVEYGYQQPFMRPAIQQFQQRGQNGRYAPRRSGNSQPPQQQWIIRNNNEEGRYGTNGRQRMGSSMTNSRLDETEQQF